MADAKKTLELTVDDSQLKALNKELASGQQEVEKYKAKLKELEKATQNGNTATAEQTDRMVKLRQAINTQAAENKRLADAIKNTTKEMNKQNEAAQALAAQQTGFGALIDGIKQGFADAGINLGGFTDKLGSLSAAMNSTTLLGAGIVTSAAAIGGALIDAGRDVSAMANQFIAYGKTMENATELYNEFNAVYRNTNYDEQAVYDLAKGFLNVGMSAQESAKMIMVCADTSASLGQGIEMTNMLADCFKRLATGGELTERQYKALAEAGIDLSDVQDEMRAGGETAFEALKNKLAQYEGGMANAKQTAAEMEGDIKGNLIEIGRQTALLVDEFLGFSETLRSFYQWVIDASQAAIDGIKNMIKSFREAKASADDYAKAMEEYGEIDEDNPEEVAKRADYIYQQCQALKSERQEAELLNEELLKTQALTKPVHTIAKVSGSGTKKATTKTDNSAANGYRELLASQKEEISLMQQKNALANKHTAIIQQQALLGLSEDERKKKQREYDQANYDTQMKQEKALHDQREANLKILTNYLTAHPFDGSDKILQNITAQYAAEESLWKMRMENEQAIMDLKNAKDKQDDLDAIEADIQKEIQLWQNYAQSISGSIGSAVSAVVNGQKTMGQALKDIAKQIISNALATLAQWLSLVAILAAFQAPHPGRIATYMMFGTGGSGLSDADESFMGVKKATGGYISGPGTSTSDSIPAMLSNGEYVLNASSVDAIGVDNLNRINAAGRNADAFVGSSTIGGSVTLNVSAMDASGFGDFLNRGGLDRIKQALFEDNRGFGAEVGAW